MTDFLDLLRTHGAPIPRAVTMETEVRSEGALTFAKLAVPDWASDLKSSSVLAEWRCDLAAAGLRDLQKLLKTLVGGKPTQQVINEALIAADIGTYLGTFIEEGMMVDGAATVRILFAYRFNSLGSIAAINTAFYQLLTAPPADRKAGSDALAKLRALWAGGTNRREGGLMMLSEVSLDDPAQFPFSSVKP